MRLSFSGPRMFGGLIRPGVGFGREDLRLVGVGRLIGATILIGIIAMVLFGH